MAGNFKVLDLSSLRKALIFSSILHLNFNFSAFCLSSSLASNSWNTPINVHACKLQRPIKLWNAQYLLFLLHHFLLFRGWGWLWLVHGSHDAEISKLDLASNAWTTKHMFSSVSTRENESIAPAQEIHNDLLLLLPLLLKLITQSQPWKNWALRWKCCQVSWHWTLAWDHKDTDHWHETTKIAIRGDMCRN